MKEDFKKTFLYAVLGNNFSGKSNFLKSLNNEKKDDSKVGFLYLGELPNNYITGIFPTVKSEIELHTVNTTTETLNAINNLLELYRFERHFNKNPFDLSGGEQAILIIISSLLLEPKLLAIDSTIEQLNEEWSHPLLNAIQQGGFPNTEIYLADNRLKEYSIVNFETTFLKKQEVEYKHKFFTPHIAGDLKNVSTPCHIELKNLIFKYNKHHLILNGINVRLEPGNIYQLSGKNGAGKTTFAKILTGLLPVKANNLYVNGVEYNAYKYPGHFVGYSFQNPDEQIFCATVEKEITKSIDNLQRGELFMEIFGLSHVRNCHPADLPFVIRKRISLAATLSIDRPWYILDEPTLGQDDEFIDFLVDLLNKLVLKGRGIIIISHSKTFTKRLNGKHLNLVNGTLTL